jgi:glycerophosphoryl diester phosphodiesterase
MTIDPENVKVRTHIYTRSVIQHLIFAALVAPAQQALGQAQVTGPLQPRTAPIVIAHRGASGYLPEHTLAAYSTAVLQGADFVELDLVSTQDGQLIARHDNVLDLTTDVAEHPEFADRRVEKVVDGRTIDGWFSEDFTLAEIRSLRAVERIPAARPANARFNGLYGVPTLEEAIATIKSLQRMLVTDVGLYIELKHPTYFSEAGLPMENALAQILRDNGYEEADQSVFLQSFEVTSLRRLNDMTNLRLVQLLDTSGQPYDQRAAGGSLTYAEMASASGLREIAAYADGVGPEKYHYLMAPDENDWLALENATDFVALAHSAGLLVHPYTFRAENRFLPTTLRTSENPRELGDASMELALFLALGIDGFFTDHTDIGVIARERYLRDN